MNNKGQMAMYEFLVILVLMGIAGWATYAYIHKPSMNNIYQAESKPIVQQPQYEPHFGCDNVKVTEYFERSSNAVSNKVTH